MSPSHQKILNALKTGLMTAEQLTKETGLSRCTIDTRISQLHTDRLVHITEYLDEGFGRMCALWKFGDGEDAKKVGGRPGQAHSLMRRLREASASGLYGPFACLIGQMQR